jgi:hypothetical protein
MVPSGKASAAATTNALLYILQIAVAVPPLIEINDLTHLKSKIVVRYPTAILVRLYEGQPLDPPILLWKVFVKKIVVLQKECPTSFPFRLVFRRSGDRRPLRKCLHSL